MTLQKEFAQVLQEGFHAVEVLQKGFHAVQVLQKGLDCGKYVTICYGSASQVWFKMPWKEVRRQLTSQSARSRSPHHGLVSLHGQKESQQLQGAVAPAFEADPTPGSSDYLPPHQPSLP